MKCIKDGSFEGERAQYGSINTRFEHCLFHDGESPLKECRNIEVDHCTFAWKYPLWYGQHMLVTNCTWQEMARSGVWDSEDIHFKDCEVAAPKNFRRCKNVSLENVNFPLGQETIWHINGLQMKNVYVKGDYFGMNCNDIEAENLTIDGNYCFDGARNVKIKHAKLNSKDSFWNCENVYLEDCQIDGEYFGWNSKNLTLVNCTVSSNQGFCYIQGLKLVNCYLPNCDLSFELCSEIEADVKGEMISIKNPISGSIHVEKVGEIILDPARIDPNKTKIVVGK